MENIEVKSKWTGFYDVFVNGCLYAGFDNRTAAYQYKRYLQGGGNIRPCYFWYYEVDQLRKCSLAP